MKRTKFNIFLMLFMLSISILFTACNKSEDVSYDEEVEEEKVKKKKKDKDKDKEDDKDDDKGKDAEITATVALGNDEEIMAFLEGKWELVDTDTDKSFASLSFDENGNCTFEKDGVDATCEGNISFGYLYAHKGERPDYFELSIEDIPDGFSGSGNYIAPESDTLGGSFYIGRGATEDYLYLFYTGNGDSYIGSIMFNSADDPDYMNSKTTWVLRREHEEFEIDDSDMGGAFFGFIWQSDDDGTLYVQKMMPHNFDTYDEYTLRKFVGCYFDEFDDICIRKYTVAAGTDLSLVREDDLKKDYPLVMYGFAADENGVITGLSETDKSYGGLYDAGEREPEFSYDGLNFRYNGSVYDISYQDCGANAITDCTQVGNRIVVEGHINPHNSAYLIFNTDLGDFEKVIYGTNFIWKDNDISTAVYAQYNQIYNYKGNLIGIVSGEEITELSFEDNGTDIKAEYYGKDNETLYSEEFEIEENNDSLMYRYYDYRNRPTLLRWKEFVKEADDNAVMFIMINPPQEIQDRVWNERVIDENALDMLYIVPLCDDLTVSVESGELTQNAAGDFEWTTKSEGEKATYQKGDVVSYHINVPEGMPERSIKFEHDGKSGYYIVQPISGKSDINCIFVSE
ncbi:MAG: hypothetical protein K6G69_07665 [Lachnospiraceae bacterium]|nr:hypothetical protein [Lachnospiraceae bacterium]